ncbi:hypothetical protein EW026_g7954 [Hermanssonia centrifuga]|uniref:Aldos-2-ulose dehydratase/isomerase (AUDH) Cupin domain-containing protein n=1 Tax=Hermanssonia centrifuga TaxID=98765 RepID=A0A4S4K651_9APHY|nr:hypothetical protein EW026_g7954 [Hermanssonia centrifuga]
MQDFATISYSVPGYFESPNPSINIFLSTGILAERLDEEVSFNIVRASSTRFTTETEFLDVSARKLALVILPPDTSYGVAEDSSGVKVLAGALSWVEVLNKLQERTSAARPFGCQTMTVNAGAVMSGKEGAVFVVLKPSNTSGTPPYSSMDQLVSHNIFPATYSADVRAMEFPWVKVQDRPWAHGRFKDLEFYNLVGFHVHYADDSLDDLVHMQLWTAGKGVSAGFHNHVEKSFCEIHACIVNGTGQGGMRWATVPDQNFDPEDPDLDKTELVVVPDMHEHGPLWHTGPDGHPSLRMNDTIDYPWHAWLAGDGDPNSEQSFDVWVAFEFPSFETFSTPARPPAIKPGKYSILDPITQAVVILKDDNATDGTPVLATLPGVVSSAKVRLATAR